MKPNTEITWPGPYDHLCFDGCVRSMEITGPDGSVMWVDSPDLPIMLISRPVVVDWVDTQWNFTL